MNILVASVYHHDSYSRGIMPDILQSQIDRNPDAKIYYLSNSNSFDLCYFNLGRDPAICYRCKTGVKNTMDMIDGSFEHLTISQIIREEDYQRAREFFREKETIDFDQVFDNFEVGGATLSTYISRSRDRDLVEVRQDYVKELAVNALALYLGTKRFLEEKKIDLVFNFNGRQEYVRGILRASQAAGTTCYNLERARIGGYLEFHRNVLTHTIRSKQALVERAWKNARATEQEKIRIGSNFFERQRAGESVIFPTYLKGQEKDQLPEGISNGNKNVVLFNSSDDEFAALGEEFRNPFFSNQDEGIEYLVDLIGERMREYNLVIRMHPNLSGVRYEYVEKLRNLHQKYPNIFVVSPESSIDSYALIGVAEKVISFGSTLGLEANFSGKPVILLGKCFYFYSGVAYVPENREAIHRLLARDLPPLEKLQAIKFGYYYLQGGVKANYYHEKELNGAVYFKGKKISTFTTLQRLRSKIIEKIYQHTGKRLKF